VAFWDVMWDTIISEEMEVADSFQVLEPAYELARHQIPEDCDIEKVTFHTLFTKLLDYNCS